MHYFFQSDNAKYVKATAAIDFGAYKKKLKFTGSAVDALEVSIPSITFIEWKWPQFSHITVFVVQH